MVLSCLSEVCNNSPRAPNPSRVGRHTRQGCARELAVWDLPQQQLDLANVAGTIVMGPEAREALGNSIQHHISAIRRAGAADHEVGFILDSGAAGVCAPRAHSLIQRHRVVVNTVPANQGRQRMAMGAQCQELIESFFRVLPVTFQAQERAAGWRGDLQVQCCSVFLVRSHVVIPLLFSTGIQSSIHILADLVLPWRCLRP